MLSVMLFGIAGVASADPYSSVQTCRNDLDDDYVTTTLPSAPTSTAHSVLMHRMNVNCAYSWLAFPAEYWSILFDGATYGSNNFYVRPKASAINITQLEDANYYLLSTSTVQSWINNAVSPLQADVYDLEWWNIQLINNLYGTSTTMSVESATTTNGLMSQAQSDKLASYPAYSTLLSTLGAQSDWSQASTTAPDFIKNKPTIPTITVQPHISDASNNASTTAATNASTTAPTNAPTNLNVLTTLLGALTGEVNATNARQNQIGANLNDLAVKYNDAMNKYNDAAAKYNAAADKLNAIIDALEANGILTP